MDLRVALGFGLTASFRFGLAGMDTPEIFGPNASAENHEAAELTANWLADRMASWSFGLGRVTSRRSESVTGSPAVGVCDVFGPDGEPLVADLHEAGHAE